MSRFRPVPEPSRFPPVTPCGEEGAREMAARMKELCPEAVNGLIKPLYEVGLIEGWRNVIYVEPAMHPLPKTRKG